MGRKVESEPVYFDFREDEKRTHYQNYDFLKFATFKKYFLH